jgi:hypothetical protein
VLELHLHHLVLVRCVLLQQPALGEEVEIAWMFSEEDVHSCTPFDGAGLDLETALDGCCVAHVVVKVVSR